MEHTSSYHPKASGSSKSTMLEPLATRNGMTIYSSKSSRGRPSTLITEHKASLHLINPNIICHLYVPPRLRNQQIARTLLRTIKEYYDHLMLYPSPLDNTTSLTALIDFYRSEGFEFISPDTYDFTMEYYNDGLGYPQ